MTTGINRRVSVDFDRVINAKIREVYLKTGRVISYREASKLVIRDNKINIPSFDINFDDFY